MAYQRENLLVSVEERIATVTLNRPDSLNATSPMHAELERVWLDLDADEDVDVVILTGAGRAFSAGGDVKAMAARIGQPDYMKFLLKQPGGGRRLIDNMLSLTKPVICAINGDAVGLGATMALLCDVTVMSETARIGDPHVRVGLVAGDGGAVIWPLLIGPNRAKELLMRASLIDGPEAHRMGLVNHVVAPDAVMPEALRLAREIAANPRWAVRWTKQSVNKWLKQQVELILDASLALETVSFLTADHGEAAKAAAEKRPPTYTGY